jgi:hypothetical protein
MIDVVDQVFIYRCVYFMQVYRMYEHDIAADWPRCSFVEIAYADSINRSGHVADAERTGWSYEALNR